MLQNLSITPRKQKLTILQERGRIAAKLLGMKSSEDKDGIGYRMGIGVQYNFDEHWAARLVGRYAAIDMDNVDHIVDITAGVRYHF